MSLYLNIDNFKLRELNKFDEILVRIDCQNNFFETLPRLPIGLKFLNCRRNILNRLPELPLSLINLSCDFNKLVYLGEYLPDSIIWISCRNNLLVELPNLLNTKLLYLNCGNNYLCQIPELPSDLVELWCNDNPIKFISSRNQTIIRNIYRKCQKNVNMQNTDIFPNIEEFIEWLG